MQAKVSVILPCYNVEKYIARSIQSILDQTYSDFELLVVIDGSPDNSKQIAETFTDSRIKIFEKENGGLSDARNYGLERANGEFIYFMDSDDWIEPDLLEENLKIVEEENLDFVVFGYIQDDEDKQGNVISSKKVIPKLDKLTKGDKNIEIDSHHIGLIGYAWNKIYRKSFIDKYNFRFEKGTSLIEDILFNAPIYQVSSVIRFNKAAYYHYLNRPVITLMKTFHADSFELKKKKSRAISGWFDAWDIGNRKEILGYLLIQGIRYCIHNLFSYKNQLSFGQKRDYIRMMYSDQMTREYIGFYQAKSRNAHIYKFLIKNKLAWLTCIIANINK